MTSPFLPIVNSSASSSTGTSEVGRQAIKPSAEEQGQSTVAFADVLEGTQHLQKEGGDVLNNPSDEEQVLFQEFNQGEIVGVLEVQVSSQALVTGPSNTGVSALVQTKQTQSVITQGQGPAGGAAVTAQTLLTGVVQPIAVSGASFQESRRSEIIGQSISPFDGLPLTNRANPSTEVKASQLANLLPHDAASGGRIRPLLHESASEILNSRPPLIPGANVGSQYSVDVQQALVKLEAAGNTSPINIGALYAQNRLPQLPEEPSSLLTRTEGEAKASGSIGLSQSGEAGLGNSGNGLPFGHHTGSGQGQLFDSTPVTQSVTSQSQGAIKANNFDDRLQLFQASVPHRLQIDVQLSEANRVQVDVGVQQRQVYAGVLLDNPALRSLAAQNIQALEEQLGQADFELEEFDVHDGQLLNESSGQEQSEQRNFEGNQSRKSEASVRQRGQENSLRYIGADTGWHLVV
ncbi:MAG: hypothetical protein ACPGYT_03500 [Nitrospirales bacterium]